MNHVNEWLNESRIQTGTRHLLPIQLFYLYIHDRAKPAKVPAQNTLIFLSIWHTTASNVYNKDVNTECKQFVLQVNLTATKGSAIQMYNMRLIMFQY